jgi:hypothetical protein
MQERVVATIDALLDDCPTDVPRETTTEAGKQKQVEQ